MEPSDPTDALPTSEVLSVLVHRLGQIELVRTTELGMEPRRFFLRPTEVQEIYGIIREAVVTDLASGGDAAIRDAVDWFGAAHLPDAPLGEIERCRNVLLGVIAAQRAAEAARVRELEETEALVLRWGKAFDAMEVTLYDNVGDFASITEEWQAANKAMRDYWAIRALREAPRG